MQRNFSLIAKWFLLAALLVMALPAMASAQRLSVVVRPRRHVMVYQTQPRVIYQQNYAPPYYGVTQPYYGARYYSYGYPTPYYGTGYSYTYSQPYYANPYAYTSPTYGYTYREYRPRHRRSRAQFGIYLR
jgi:hypothetical protein